MRECPVCHGTGWAPCGRCGRPYAECVCDDPIELECLACDGVGDVMEEKPIEVEEDEE